MPCGEAWALSQNDCCEATSPVSRRHLVWGGGSQSIEITLRTSQSTWRKGSTFPLSFFLHFYILEKIESSSSKCWVQFRQLFDCSKLSYSKNKIKQHRDVLNCSGSRKAASCTRKNRSIRRRISFCKPGGSKLLIFEILFPSDSFPSLQHLAYINLSKFSINFSVFYTLKTNSGKYKTRCRFIIYILHFISDFTYVFHYKLTS